MDQSLYAYCPNAQCPHRQDQEQTPYAEQAEAPQFSPGSTCPHCNSGLRIVCPQCGDPLLARPQRFCPSCGAGLFDALSDTPCRICGRPAAGHVAGGREVPVCSERCLRRLIQEHVRVCDQCGVRFIFEDQVPDTENPQNSLREGDTIREFCSYACREQYLVAKDG